MAQRQSPSAKRFSKRSSVSPELDELLAALYERDNCEPSELPKREENLQRLLELQLQKHPGLNRAKLLESVHSRYVAFCRAQRKTSTIPPKA